MVQNPEAYGLDFVFVAVFTALVTTLWRGQQDLTPWLVAAATAILCQQLLPGKWYIVLGGIGGALVPACFPSKGAGDPEAKPA